MWAMLMQHSALWFNSLSRTLRCITAAAKTSLTVNLLIPPSEKKLIEKRAKVEKCFHLKLFRNISLKSNCKLCIYSIHVSKTLLTLTPAVRHLRHPSSILLFGIFNDFISRSGYVKYTSCWLCWEVPLIVKWLPPPLTANKKEMRQVGLLFCPLGALFDWNNKRL